MEVKRIQRVVRGGVDGTDALTGGGEPAIVQVHLVVLVLGLSSLSSQAKGKAAAAAAEILSRCGVERCCRTKSCCLSVCLSSFSLSRLPVCLSGCAHHRLLRPSVAGPLCSALHGGGGAAGAAATGRTVLHRRGELYHPEEASRGAGDVGKNRTCKLGVQWRMNLSDGRSTEEINW